MQKAIQIKFDNFLDILTSQRDGALGYLTASVLVLIAFLVRLAIAPTNAGMPFLIFFLQLRWLSCSVESAQVYLP
jgi:hypothetical protein